MRRLSSSSAISPPSATAAARPRCSRLRRRKGRDPRRACLRLARAPPGGAGVGRLQCVRRFRAHDRHHADASRRRRAAHRTRLAAHGLADGRMPRCPRHLRRRRLLCHARWRCCHDHPRRLGGGDRQSEARDRCASRGSTGSGACDCRAGRRRRGCSAAGRNRTGQHVAAGRSRVDEPPPEQAPAVDETASVAPEESATPDEVASIPPEEDATLDEVASIPSRESAPRDDVVSAPPVDASLLPAPLRRECC